MLTVNSPIVSVAWLHQHLQEKNLIILDAYLPKAGVNVTEKKDKEHIPNTLFFDLKKVFSKQDAPYPNTVLEAKEFQEKAQVMGIQNNSCIVVYDTLDMYASPRVWWLFQLMGFKNIAVLNGGFSAWKNAGYPIVKKYKKPTIKGNFLANFQSEKIKYTDAVLAAIPNPNSLIIDARSSGRFIATEPEPREEVKGGHIPNAVNLPYQTLLSNGKIKPTEELKNIFAKINPQKKEIIFSCGSGITACILALAAEMTANKNYTVYDGSWTEWGSTSGLPIEK